MREGELVVEIQPLRVVKSLTDYNAVVMGTALNVLRLHAHQLVAEI